MRGETTLVRRGRLEAATRAMSESWLFEPTKEDGDGG
jgi:hypothetical protein